MNKNLKAFDKKLFLQYALILVFSLCIGAFLPKFLNEDFLFSQYKKISLHFQVPVYSIEQKCDWLFVMLRYAFADIICFCILFLGFFTSSKSIVASASLIYIGIKNACEISLVSHAYISKLEYAPLFSEICVFFAFKILLLALFVRYIIHASLFSEHISFVARSKAPIAFKVLKFIVYSLLHIAALLLLHGIYCLIIKSI